MKRTLFLLVFYTSLVVAVGKPVRSFFPGVSFSVKTLLLDFKTGEAEENEADSEDTDNQINDDKEIGSQFSYDANDSGSVEFQLLESVVKDHPREIGTPPPRL